MPREAKLLRDLQPDDTRLWEKKPMETIERKYRLVTPLFGGGVEPFKADPVTAVRASEIKSHLRFWWRALFGWKAADSPKTLLELEEAIWGGVSTTKSRASSVKLAIKLLASGEEVHPLYLGTNHKGKQVVKHRKEIAHPYIAFSLEQKIKDKQTGKEKKILHPVKQGVAFELKITYPTALKQDVEAALWAWETFGGIGGRTRRGFGAIVPLDSPEQPYVKAKELRDKLDKYVEAGQWPEGVPHLTPDSQMYVFPGSWSKLVERYQQFRQWRNGPRGRSKWPEPDEIRRLTKTYSPGHEPHHPVHKFPRGQFGLPIIFHFKDKKNGDPDDTTLKGENFERLASPLGFKPLGENGPVLVYVLEGNRRLPEPYVLAGRGTFEVGVELTPDEARNIEPLMAVGAEPDPIKAFIKWLEQGGKQ